jgi:hypothetical protein
MKGAEYLIVEIDVMPLWVPFRPNNRFHGERFPWGRYGNNVLFGL